MTIHFNPGYDSSVFLTAGDCGLGKAFYGSEALLAELELRAGLTCTEEEHSSRVISYMDAMQAALDRAAASGDSPFFAESFCRDDYGTAELMLGWRDALVKAGWDGKPVGNSDKIRILSDIEAFFDCPGSADRWRALSKEAAARPILRPTDRIIVQCRKEDLPPVLRNLFDSIGKHYSVPVVEYRSEALPLAESHDAFARKCRIIDFEDEYSAHEWIASQDLGADDVVAEADQALLGDLLHFLGKPGIGAADEGIGAVMRLLPLGLSLFKYPADIKSLQSYLQSPRTPLGKLYTECKKDDGTTVYTSAVRQLFKHICSEGGFGPKWDEIIDGALYAFDGSPLSAKDRGEALKFIGMWDQSKDLPAGEVPRAGVEAFIKGLHKWAGRHVNPEDRFNAQFIALQRNCATMLRLIGRRSSATIPVKTLAQWACHVCKPINISSDFARVGSINAVGSVADIYSAAARLIWFASTTENDLPYDYGFLSPEELRTLAAAGLLIPEKEALARMDRAYRLEGLSRCADVKIVTCKRISGVETVRGALLAEIASFIKPEPGTPVARTEAGNVETDFGKAASHSFDPKVMVGFNRDLESYSSIDELIENPVDYMLDYVKGYRQYGIDELADLQTTEGTVAHAYIEALGELCGNDPGAMLAMHRSGFDSILVKVISENGLVMHLEENALELKSFRAGLRDSVEVLLDIIGANKLEIVGFEYKITSDIPGVGPVLAKIDCLLKDPSNGKYVIFDFKYSHSKTYQHKIEESRELQLAVYRTLVERELGEVEFTGYYSIPRKKLFTSDDTLHHRCIEVVQADLSQKEIFDKAVKGYIFRRGQLRQGIAEEGEDLKLGLLDYFHQTGLYDLEVNYDDKGSNRLAPEEKRKARAYGDKNITLKGGLN